LLLPSFPPTSPRLGEEVDNVLAAGADIVHFDVMDNHYVPNLTIGPLVCEALRKHGVTAPIDVHLMVKPVDRIIPDFAKAGATYITFHPEASEHIDRTIGLIKESGCKAGLVFNPATPLDVLEYTLPKLDMVLLMSVNPGFGGQKFIPYVLDKAKKVRAMMMPAATTAAWRSTVASARPTSRSGPAGVDTFVAGSAIFGAPRTPTPTATTASLRRCAPNWRRSDNRRVASVASGESSTPPLRPLDYRHELPPPHQSRRHRSRRHPARYRAGSGRCGDGDGWPIWAAGDRSGRGEDLHRQRRVAPGEARVDPRHACRPGAGAVRKALPIYESTTRMGFAQEPSVPRRGRRPASHSRPAACVSPASPTRRRVSRTRC
jgi:ribulose-phosphate 3-epimerase